MTGFNKKQISQRRGAGGFFGGWVFCLFFFSHGRKSFWWTCDNSALVPPSRPHAAGVVGCEPKPGEGLAQSLSRMRGRSRALICAAQGVHMSCQQRNGEKENMEGGEEECYKM